MEAAASRARQRINLDHTLTVSSRGCLLPEVDVGRTIHTIQSKLFITNFVCLLSSYAAKSCDEIGRIAAVLSVIGEWDSEIPREVMRIKWKENTK